LQAKPQVPPEQVGIAFGGAVGHTLQEVPQLNGLESETQLLPHA
jgi:hypothetical protein